MLVFLITQYDNLTVCCMIYLLLLFLLPMIPLPLYSSGCTDGKLTITNNLLIAQEFSVLTSPLCENCENLIWSLVLVI